MACDKRQLRPCGCGPKASDRFSVDGRRTCRSVASSRGIELPGIGYRLPTPAAFDVATSPQTIEQRYGIGRTAGLGDLGDLAGKRSRKIMAFQIAQDAQVRAALASGDTTLAMRLAAASPWRPAQGISAEQATAAFAAPPTQGPYNTGDPMARIRANIDAMRQAAGLATPASPAAPAPGAPLPFVPSPAADSDGYRLAAIKARQADLDAARQQDQASQQQQSQPQPDYGPVSAPPPPSSPLPGRRLGQEPDGFYVPKSADEDRGSDGRAAQLGPGNTYVAPLAPASRDETGSAPALAPLSNLAPVARSSGDTSPRIPTTTPTTPTTPAVRVVGGGPSPAPAGPAHAGMVNLPFVGPVSKPVAAASGLGLGYLLLKGLAIL